MRLLLSPITCLGIFSLTFWADGCHGKIKWIIKSFDLEQILICDYKIIYNEHYGKHTRQQILEITPSSLSWRLQTNFWVSLWMAILSGRWQRKDLTTQTIDGVLVLILSHTLLQLFIQAAPPVGSWKENSLDTAHFLFWSPIFLFI